MADEKAPPPNFMEMLKEAVKNTKVPNKKPAEDK